jgi:2-polyprenyl-3-methyl-5-hydroxy-6-metoxy-1,4-benzoquinol methylase
VITERIARHYSNPWLRCYARGKLWRDPVYAAAFELLKGSPLPVLDVGCGIGLFEFYLRERGFVAPLFGIDYDAKKIARAQRIAGRVYSDVQFTVDDVLATGDFRGHVVCFDVIHYLSAARQATLLEHLAAHVAPGAYCLIRATPRDTNWRFRFTQVQEFLLHGTLWMKSAVMHYPTSEETMAPFRARGFTCEVCPLWGRTPFNSHFYVLRN